jgi:hypothetical protein
MGTMESDDVLLTGAIIGGAIRAAEGTDALDTGVRQ